MRKAVSGDPPGGGLMLMRSRRNQVDYSLCRQKVTVYHKEGDTVKRTVFDRAFLDFRKNLTVDKTGSRDSNAFLLVIPGNTQAVFVGDKVLMGEGPEVSTREQWAAFIPANVPGLCVVKYADPKYWGTQFVHVEAGG